MAEEVEVKPGEVQPGEKPPESTEDKTDWKDEAAKSKAEAEGAAEKAQALEEENSEFRKREVERLAAEGEKKATQVQRPGAGRAPAVQFTDPATGQVVSQEDLQKLFDEEPLRATQLVVAAYAQQVPGMIAAAGAGKDGKARALEMLPDLKDPKSPLFREVALYTQKNEDLYAKGDGLALAAALKARELGIAPTTPSPETDAARERLAAAGTVVEGKGKGKAPEAAPAEEGAALNVLAGRLGVSPEKVAERLAKRRGE